MSQLAAIQEDLRSRFPTLCGVRSQEVERLQPRPLDRTAIILGRDQKRAPVGLPLRVRLEHLLIVGATGSGKSRELLHYLRQVIRNGEGALFLDPHGDHKDSTYRALVSSIAEARRVHLFDFNSASHTLGFNPLACPPGTDVSVIAGNVLDALSVSWEGESFSQKPTIERVLTVVFSALAELGLTLVEAPMLLDHKDEQGLRAYAIQHIQDRYTRDELKRLHELSQDGRRRRDFDQEVVGPLNRLQRLLRPQALRLMLGQTKPVLDMQAAMDSGDIILANLSGGSRVYEKDADLFGRLLVRTALFHAKRRENDRPFNVVLDEAHRFLSGDIPVLLAEVRKNGISIVAAIQWLEQASTDDDKILAALLNGTNGKICFRLRDAEEAEKLAHSNVPLDLEVPVSSLNKPAVVGHRLIHLGNESTSDQESVTDSVALIHGKTTGRSSTVGESATVSSGHFEGEADMHSVSDMQSSGHGKSAGSGDSASAGEVMVPTGEYWSPMHTSAETEGTNSSASSAHSSSSSESQASNSGKVVSSGFMESESHGYSYADSRSTATTSAETRGRATSLGTGKTAGFSEALEPIIKWLPSSVHSKDNMLYKAGQMLRSLPTGIAYLNYVGKDGPVSTLFTVPPIFTPVISPEEFGKVRDSVMATSSAAISIEDAVANIVDREQEMLARKPPTIPKAKPAQKRLW